MTLQEFNETNWHRGNVAKLKNGKEYLVKGTKAHGRYLLLYSVEFDKCFVADHNIIDCRTSDYEEPEEVYQERKRQKQAEAQAMRDAEREERLRRKEERKQKNLLEQERIHQEALARKAAKSIRKAEKKAEKNKVEAKAEPKAFMKAETVATSEPAQEQPKRKRLRIKVNRAEKVQINKKNC